MLCGWEGTYTLAITEGEMINIFLYGFVQLYQWYQHPCLTNRIKADNTR